MQDAKEEVRSRLNIEDVIGEYVQLKRAGRSFKGLSPFSQEKTPSFYVSPDKQIWHDFSSNKGGDVFSFVMEVEGLGFREALELLARKAGVELAQYSGSKDLAERKKRLISALETAANYYQHSLLKNTHALDYVLKTRGLNKQIITDFRVGYAPTQGRALVEFLRKKGYSDQELREAGLVNQYGGDLFRGRMTIPLADSQGQVIGFTARILSDEPNAPKYLNTPQTLLYDKSRHVFGLHLAKESIRTLDYAVMVEGNMDVIASHQAGVRQVVATAGTALTEQHLRAIMRLTGNIRLSFDADRAGIAATERAIPIAQALGVSLSVIVIKSGEKDPDELIKRDVKLWEQAIESAQPAVDWLLEQYASREDVTTAAGKRSLTTQALALITAIKDPVEAEHYMRRVSQMTGASVEALQQKQAGLERRDAPRLKPVAVPKSPGVLPAQFAYQDDLLELAIVDTAVHNLFTADVLELFDGARRNLAEYISLHPGERITQTPEGLMNDDMYVNMIIIRAEDRYGSWTSEDRMYQAADLFRQLSNQHANNKKQTMLLALRDAEAQGDETKAEEIRRDITKLLKEMGQK